jgi:hypothetical protein
MIVPAVVLAIRLCVGTTPLHGALSGQPVPHWVVLLVAVPALWLCIGGAVLVIDGLFDWIGTNR